MEKNRLVICRNVVLVLSLLTAACSSRPCREPRQPDLDVTSKKAAADAPPSPSEIAMSGPGTPKPVTPPVAAPAVRPLPPPTLPARIRVYKPDGSRQCENRPGKAVEVMERELAGIAVHAREKRKDGLMHIQVCGSPTGVVNLYEIDSSFLKQAEERGFKRFED